MENNLSKPGNHEIIGSDTLSNISIKDNLKPEHWKFPSSYNFRNLKILCILRYFYLEGRDYIDRNSNCYRKMCHLIKLGGQKLNNNYDEICLIHWSLESKTTANNHNEAKCKLFKKGVYDPASSSQSLEDKIEAWAYDYNHIHNGFIKAIIPQFKLAKNDNNLEIAQLPFILNPYINNQTSFNPYMNPNLAHQSNIYMNQPNTYMNQPNTYVNQNLNRQSISYPNQNLTESSSSLNPNLNNQPNSTLNPNVNNQQNSSLNPNLNLNYSDQNIPLTKSNLQTSSMIRKENDNYYESQVSQEKCN